MKTKFVFRKPKEWDDGNYHKWHLQHQPEDWMVSLEESAKTIGEYFSSMTKEEAILELNYTERTYRFLSDDEVEITLPR